ncbi:hypothetical protein CI238_02054, partial [Colletotrichum incanum]
LPNLLFSAFSPFPWKALRWSSSPPRLSSCPWAHGSRSLFERHTVLSISGVTRPGNPVTASVIRTKIAYIFTRATGHSPWNSARTSSLALPSVPTYGVGQNVYRTL